MKVEPIYDEPLVEGGPCMDPVAWSAGFGKENARKMTFSLNDQVQAFELPDVGYTLCVESNGVVINYICCDNTNMGQLENAGTSNLVLESSKIVGLYVTNETKCPVSMRIWFFN